MDTAYPRHIAIIMDGNGRWAKLRHLPRTLGHREGIFRVKEIVKAASDLKIEALTLYVFSCENWSRPESEVNTLMKFLSIYLGREVSMLCKNNIRVRFIGRRKHLPRSVLDKIELVEEKTKGNTGLTLVLAINYGSRQEMLDAVKEIVKDCEKGKLSAADLTEESISGYLYTQGLPDPDLLIRTSGEQRLSNFLLWQLSYAELYFTKKYWPDFKKADLMEALEDYGGRLRRFGGIDVEKK
ncbi:MAG: isoprenyl transferase [Candidatus Omnitrophica bacterium]|jgi:undecaprenyl diphosphate synthase|nr:isoprenyl transferase [Candidatus Omnitrophota bacterium]